MGDAVWIEDIAEMRRRQGIDDVDLRDDIRGLAVGDLVRLTLRADDQSPAGETLVVRVTDVAGEAFHGTLAVRPVSKGLADLRVGFPVAFTAAHIHSLPKGRKVHGP
jgi:hypothetical protein